MNPTLFLVCFFLYILGMIWFGWWVTRKKQSGGDFLLGGRSLPLFLTLGTTLATMVGTGSSMGAVGKAYQSGWMGALYGVGGAMGILIMAWLFAPVRRHRFMTMAEELSSYVGANRSVANLVGVFTFLSSVGWLGAHILGGGKYLEFVTGMDPLWAKTWIALGFGIYAAIGGYRAVVWTDTLQAVVLFGGFLITALYAFRLVGGWDGLDGINAQLAAEAGAGIALPSVSLIVAIAVGVLGTPSFRQRIYSGESIKAIRKAFVGSGLLSGICRASRSHRNGGVSVQFGFERKRFGFPMDGNRSPARGLGDVDFVGWSFCHDVECQFGCHRRGDDFASGSLSLCL